MIDLDNHTCRVIRMYILEGFRNVKIIPTSIREIECYVTRQGIMRNLFHLVFDKMMDYGEIFEPYPGKFQFIPEDFKYGKVV